MVFGAQNTDTGSFAITFIIPTSTQQQDFNQMMNIPELVVTKQKKSLIKNKKKYNWDKGRIGLSGAERIRDLEGTTEDGTCSRLFPEDFVELIDPEEIPNRNNEVVGYNEVEQQVHEAESNIIIKPYLRLGHYMIIAAG
ncbi:hypothetical protein Glove_37g187 [Diversispora epigaea]|uniref:Uncharacterized protein n=1 Tax=Diversispora epigaea TaxID=1348612 RepID=A0A397JMS9_9GLOM|nr:hypothetical protein Glove_37g187 [Diversispora epigaea]